MDIRKRSKILRATVGCMGLLLLQLNSPFVNADGFETLGPPTGITIENGTGLISAGIGLSQAQPGNLVFDSGTATIVQVLLYWAGNSNNSTHTPPGDGLGDPDITVNGIPVNGTRIMNGGTMTLGEANSSAYRADITDLKDGAGLPVISTGLNTLSIGGLDFTSVNYGAGVVVIVDDGSVPAHKIDVRDGNDYAFIGSSVVDQDTTVCQTFMFDSSPDSRSANLELLFSSVAGIASTGDFRPSAIDVTIGGETVSGVCGVGGTTTTYNNLLNSYDGQEWDSISIDVPVPANETQVSVQALSEQNNDDNIPAGADVGFPASFHWLAAALSIDPPPPPGGEGCTPGFYKNLSKHRKAWGGISPNDLFKDWFDNAFKKPEPDGLTLIQVLRQGGGGLKALGRHTVAALLNANNGDIASGMTVANVRDAFNDVYPALTKAEYTAQKNIFKDANESGCPINGKSWASSYEYGRD